MHTHPFAMDAEQGVQLLESGAIQAEELQDLQE